MGWRALLAVLAAVVLSASCGARTGLLLPGQGGSGSSSGASSGGGVTPLAVPCAAALLAGAPTPMQGYCPTRANQAPGNGPSAPQIAWAVTPFPIDAPENYLPAEIVVGRSGRAFVAIDASPMNPNGGPNQIFAIDPDGSIAWTAPFTSPASDLTLAIDGRLWVEGSAVGEAVDPVCVPGDGGTPYASCLGSVVALSSGGTLAGNVTFIGPPPPPYQAPNESSEYTSMTLGSDGSFFLEAVLPDFGSESSLAHASTAGAVDWQWPPLDQGENLQLVPPLVVGPSDDVVGSDGTNLVLLDAGGNQLWQEDLDVQLAAVNAQGDIVALSTDTDTLLTLDTNGNALQSSSLAVTIGTTDAAQLALAGDGTTVVLLANEATSPGITKSHVQILAVDGSGQTRWTTTLDVSLNYDPAVLTTHYGLFVDGSGTVVVTAGAVTGIDLATGSTQWTLQPPNPKACLRPAVLGAGGAILASQCDGTVFLARDP